MKKTKTILALLLSVAVASTAFAGGTKENAKAFNQKAHISVVSREEGSGTRGAFIELCGVEQKDAMGKKVDMTTEDAIITNSTAVMMTMVSGDINGIGYISLGFLNDSVKALAVDGASASVQAIQENKYKVVRALNIVTADTGDKPRPLSEEARDFLAFIISDEGQKIVAKNGFIPMTSTGAYQKSKKAGPLKVVCAGSSSVTPLMEKLKEAYLLIRPEAVIEIQQSDSTTGVNSAMSGICDIGMASRDLKNSELQAGVRSTTIARDGIAIIVNNKNPLGNISTENTKNIYMGKITTWESLVDSTN